MGIGIAELIRLFDHERLKGRPLRLLDIGAQNLSGADPASIVHFVRTHNDVWNEQDLAAYAEAMTVGAAKHPRFGGTNGAWLGDLLERIGVDYLAFDIFAGYRTVIFDLNEWSLDAKYRQAFDIVLNCGTTEHVLNQMNSFRVIHDATKVGGLIYHSLPMTGFLDHGYFNYNPRLFWELAQANDYKVHRLIYNGPGGSESVVQHLVEAYQGRIEVERAAEMPALWAGHAVPTSSLSVLLEKTVDRPFRASLEISTTVGEVASVVGETRDMAELRAAEEAMLGRLDEPGLQPEDIFVLFTRHQQVMPHRRFPLQLERKVLQLYLARTPDRTDLANRLERVEAMLVADTPLLRFPAEAGKVERGIIAMDGREAALFALEPDERRFDHAIAAYHRYSEAGRLADYPSELESIALQHAMRLRPDDPDLLVRLGRVLSDLTPRMRLRRR
jgi:hypothetical protein